MKASGTLDKNTMYQALVDKNSQYEGIFYAGVKTTGIFCRPTCTAKKPKIENVEFFSSVKEALDYGFRPCKVCKPLEPFGSTPDWLKYLLQKVNQDPGIRLSDIDLKKHDISPVRLRRWFKRHYGMTFHSYARALRINRAFGQIRHRNTVIEAAYENGYESLSGFTAAFKNKTGFPPAKSNSKQIISITRITTPIGPMLAGATSEGICLLEFTDRRMLETQFKRIKFLLNAELVPGENPFFSELQKQMDEYFNGIRKEFNLQCILPGTEFQVRVWNALQHIPYGTTSSYENQAAWIHQPTATRAVARANGDNRIAIIIPCHRVISKNGQLAGYGGGIWRKKYLLDLEAKYAHDDGR